MSDVVYYAANEERIFFLMMTSRYTVDGKKVSLLGYGAMRLPTVGGGHANNWVKDGYSASAVDQALMNRQVNRIA